MHEEKPPEEEEVALLSQGWCHALSVKPPGVVEHEQRFPTHSVLPREWRLQKQVKLVLDIPLPRLVDIRPWRCVSCSHHPQWPVAFADINQVLLAETKQILLVHKDSRSAAVLMTPRFLLYATHHFYSHMNGNELRRNVAAMYSYNAAAMISNVRADWRISAIPFADGLRSLVVRAMQTILPPEVSAMQKELLPYSAGIIRCDGNFKIAKKIRLHQQPPGERQPWSCILAFCGSDGAVLAPPTYSATEDIPDLQAVLIPLLEKVRDFRLRAGLNLQQSAPIAHCTDRYAQHRLQLANMYAQAGVFGGKNCSFLVPPE